MVFRPSGFIPLLEVPGECCQEQRLLHEEVEQQQSAAEERAKTISHWDCGEVFRRKKMVGTWSLQP